MGIVVLTPYILQRSKIDKRLFSMFHREKSIKLKNESIAWKNDRQINPVDCATIEAFQGKERKIVIVSCVRSRQENVTTDMKHHLGFMSQPQRSNVALSRAQDFLVVVGNAKLLLTDGMRKLNEEPRARHTPGQQEVHFGGTGCWNTVLERFLSMKAVINVGAPATPPEELFRTAYKMAHGQLTPSCAGDSVASSHADPNHVIIDDDVETAPLVQME